MNDITPKEAIANLNHLYGMVSPDMQRSLDVVIKAVEIPKGDLISRETLKEKLKERYYNDGLNIVTAIELIDNAPPVPQVTVFAENADENAVADLKAELQSVIEARPNEQIAWEQGYEAGLAQGKQDRPQGEWIKIDEEWYDYKCSVCGEKVRRLYPFCHCGADMRKGDAE